MQTICYCFGYTDTDIIDDVKKHDGRSTIIEKIADAKKNGKCQCEIKNPEKQ